jgi:very-short-patch-repair endonuclease
MITMDAADLRKISPHELLLLAHLEQAGLPYLTEYRHPACPRQWRLDFAIPTARLGIEVEGGIHMLGRHSRAAGFIEDCIKYNWFAEAGWRILRYPPELINDNSAIEQIVRIYRLALAAGDLLPEIAYGSCL